MEEIDLLWLEVLARSKLMRKKKKKNSVFPRPVKKQDNNKNSF